MLTHYNKTSFLNQLDFKDKIFNRKIFKSYYCTEIYPKNSYRKIVLQKLKADGAIARALFCLLFERDINLQLQKKNLSKIVIFFSQLIFSA